MSVLPVSENLIKFTVKAKFYRVFDGENFTLRLASLQRFSVPVFRPSGWELVGCDTNKVSYHNNDDTNDISCKVPDIRNIVRASRRARINALDIIMCNSDLDTFCTFTYSPEKISDKTSYEQCYSALCPWLSNRVQRNNLKYVCVPEYTKAGDIHFHAIMNSSALKLEKAYSPSGKLLKRHGKILYNISDWKHGFTSCEKICARKDDENPREAVSKYIFKYMGKNIDAKIGGRYALIGGDLLRPVYQYSNEITDFATAQELEKVFHKLSTIDETLTFEEWCFI